MDVYKMERWCIALPLQYQQYRSCLVPCDTNPMPSRYFRYDDECDLLSRQAQHFGVAVRRHDVGNLCAQCSGRRGVCAVNVAILVEQEDSPRGRSRPSQCGQRFISESNNSVTRRGQPHDLTDPLIH